MKLLLTSHNWYGEGTTVRAAKLAGALAKRGHQVSLLATSPSPFRSRRFSEGGVDIFLAPHFRDTHRGGWGWLDIPWRSAFSLSRRFDLVHAFDHKPNVVFPAWIQKVLKGAPMVSDWADWWARPQGINAGATGLKAWIEDQSEINVRHLAGWVTAISPRLVRRAIELGLPASRVLLLPSGGEAPAKGISRAAARKRFGFGPGDVVGLYLGVGNADLPLVFAGLSRASLKNMKLLVVGPAEQEKKAMALKAGVADRCVVTGGLYGADMDFALKAADFGLVPLSQNLCNQARWPNKAGEYAAAGLPLLSNPVGPLKEILPVKKAGLLVAPSPAGFARGLEGMASAAARKRMAVAARAWARSDLGWPRIARQLEAFYQAARAAQASGLE